MKKQIKIDVANRGRINAALAEANGRARVHAFSDYDEIEKIVREIESRLSSLGITKKYSVGARVTAVSGDAVSKSYALKAFSRRATRVELVRRSTGWFLVSVQGATIYRQGGYVELILTPDQDTIAVSHLRSKYAVYAVGDLK